MATTITRYEPRNGPPQWVMCVNGQIERICDDLRILAAELEEDRGGGPDSDGARA